METVLTFYGLVIAAAAFAVAGVLEFKEETSADTFKEGRPTNRDRRQHHGASRSHRT